MTTIQDPTPELAIPGQPGSAGPLSVAERAAALAALRRLQAGPGLLMRGADMLAWGVSSAARFGARGLRLAPGLEERLRGLAHALLEQATSVAVIGLDAPRSLARQRLLDVAVVTSGATGGALGLAGFAPDAALTTLAILRAIATEAARNGENPTDAETRRACLEVFLLDGESLLRGDSAREEQELPYYAARLLLRGQPVAALLNQAAARYGVVLSQKAVAASIPLLGAATGAALNMGFLSHYRDVARAHFFLRRMERLHGVETMTILREGSR
jgi:hypothetical protein